MNSYLKNIEPIDRIDETKQFTSKIDAELQERFNKVAERYGWGGKRKLLEAALRSLLDELERK